PKRSASISSSRLYPKAARLKRWAAHLRLHGSAEEGCHGFQASAESTFSRDENLGDIAKPQQNEHIFLLMNAHTVTRGLHTNFRCFGRRVAADMRRRPLSGISKWFAGDRIERQGQLEIGCRGGDFAVMQGGVEPDRLDVTEEGELPLELGGFSADLFD